MCLEPLKLEDRVVSCGNCLECLIVKQKEWTLRIEWHAKEAKTGAFITLTYDPENVPMNGGFQVLSKKDVQDFIKKLRFHQSKITDMKISYVLCGEYGENGYRPHYHLLLFDCVLINQIDEIWSKGRVDIGNIETRSIEYVVSYTLNRKAWKEEFEKCLEKPFMTFSKGIGMAYVRKNKERHLKEKKLNALVPKKTLGFLGIFERKFSTVLIWKKKRRKEKNLWRPKE